jgi:hypothetical protein
MPRIINSIVLDSGNYISLLWICIMTE